MAKYIQKKHVLHTVPCDVGTLAASCPDILEKRMVRSNIIGWSTCVQHCVATSKTWPIPAAKRHHRWEPLSRFGKHWYMIQDISIFFFHFPHGVLQRWVSCMSFYFKCLFRTLPPMASVNRTRGVGTQAGTTNTRISFHKLMCKFSPSTHEVCIYI